LRVRSQLGLLTIGIPALHLPPLLLYGYSRLLRLIPSESAWFAYGGNHGPWYTEWQGSVLGCCFLGQVGLAVLTLVLAFDAMLSRRGFRTLGYGLILFGGQVVLFWLSMRTYFWTVD